MSDRQVFKRYNLHRWVPLFLAAFLLSACSAPAWKEPVPIDQVDFKLHAVTLSESDVTVTVAVPTYEDTISLFGTSLYADRIQPVWIEIDNRSERDYTLMKVGIDRGYYSPMEAAYQRHSGSREERLEMDRFFREMAFRDIARAGKVTSGFVFTNLDEGYKAVNIDLVSKHSLLTYSFVVKVPGLITDIERVDLNALYPEWVEIEDEAELRSVLESLPCCTMNKKGTVNGDPLNIAFVGNPSDIFAALIRRGWHQTEITYGESARKTAQSFVFGSRYRYSPISPLYVFDRHQDIGLQKARESIHLRNHMRLWRTRYNFRGKEVYIGQISRDIGVKLNKRTVTTHAIDPDVDDTRNGLIGDLAYSQAMNRIALVKGSQVSTHEDTYYNLTPDPYYSDGLRAVMFFSERPTTLDRIDMLDWEITPMHDILSNPGDD